MVFEQLGLPFALARRRAALVHVTNCFLPLIRPCPGVVTIHDLAFEEWRDDFSPRTGLKYRFLTPRAARSAQRVICPSAFTARTTSPHPLRHRPREGQGDSRGARATPVSRTRAPPAGAQAPYVLAVGDLRRKKNLAALVRAFAPSYGAAELGR